MLTDDELRLLVDVLKFSLRTRGYYPEEQDLINKINAMLDKAEKV